jgi:multimeric flavodoxin WrbA
MKVLLINGSSRKECTYTALSKVAESLNEEGIETEIISLGGTAVRDCIGCNMCAKNGNTRCVFNEDIVNEIIEKAEESDGFVFGTPVYYAHPSGRILSVLDRAFYAGKKAFEFKPGASIISARRGGTVASFDVLNKYFTISQMPIVSSTYWNNVHGNNKEEVVQDLEGMQTMYNLGKNMAWLLKCIESGKQNNINKPANKTVKTNFIR